MSSQENEERTCAGEQTAYDGVRVGEDWGPGAPDLGAEAAPPWVEEGCVASLGTDME